MTEWHRIPPVEFDEAKSIAERLKPFFARVTGYSEGLVVCRSVDV
jgi:hypothetical protein